jgi:hypothetical protein
MLHDSTVAPRSTAAVRGTVALEPESALQQKQAIVLLKHDVKAEISIDAGTLDLNSGEYTDLARLYDKKGRIRLTCTLSFYDGTGSLQVHQNATGFAYALSSTYIHVDFEEWARYNGVRMVQYQMRVEANRCLLQQSEE